MSDRVRVLVLCNGNIGRSPLAAALLQKGVAAARQVPLQGLVAAGFEITSAGVEAPEGRGASTRGRAFGDGRGVDLEDHISRLLTPEMVVGSDLIFAMDRNQVDGVGRLVPGAVGKVRMWEERGTEIPDPHHESDEFFTAVARRIEAATSHNVRQVLSLRGFDRD